jgi:hypothetical protein
LVPIRLIRRICRTGPSRWHWIIEVVRWGRLGLPLKLRIMFKKIHGYPPLYNLSTVNYARKEKMVSIHPMSKNCFVNC